MIAQKFLQAFTQHGIADTKHYFVAISGGVDSVVLSWLCKKAHFNFELVHCNFGLRGEESEDDEKFVSAWAETLGVGYSVKKFDTVAYASKNKISIQEAARKLRYEWFSQLTAQRKDSRVLLAQHADDVAETALMHFVRGTGLAGLQGIRVLLPECKGFRPLLEITKKEILDYAASEKLRWREDSSNTSDKYSRNLFRNKVLPLIQQAYPQASANIRDTTRRLQQSFGLYEPMVAALKKKLLQQNGPDVQVGVHHLLQYQHTALPFEVLKDFGFTETAVPQLLSLCASANGRFFENESYQVIKNRKWIVIAKKADAAITISISEEIKKQKFESGVLTIEKVPATGVKFANHNNLAWLAADVLTYPLLLRKAKPGDYFYPLGMQKKKKVARFFIDAKLSKTEKERTWVLQSGDRIAWVVGHRIDDRFKITSGVKEAIRINLSSL